MSVETAQPKLTRRQRAAVIFFFVFLVVQISVPLWKLTEQRPARFGWQMYAGVKTPLTATLTGQKGGAVTVPTDVYLGFARGDLDVVDVLPAFICRQHAGLKSVRLNFMFSAPLEFQCKP